MSLFDSIASTRTKKQPAVKLVNFSPLEGTAEEQAEQLKEKFAKMIDMHAYVTFGELAKACGQKKYVPTMSPVLIHLVETHVEEGASAHIVNAAGKQSSRVAAGHRERLESLGYIQFPGIIAKKKAKATEDVTEVL